MRDVKFYFDLDKRRLYSASDIVNHFENYTGVSFQKLLDYFENYQIISKSSLYSYISDNIEKIKDHKFVSKEKVIERRLKDYQYFQVVLANLSLSSIICLRLLEYLANLNEIRNQNEDYEELLDKLELFHYGRVLSGEGVSKLFFVLSRLYNHFQEFLEKANCLQTYQTQTVDSFMLNYGDNEIYYDALLVKLFSNEDTHVRVPYEKLRKKYGTFI